MKEPAAAPSSPLTSLSESEFCSLPPENSQHQGQWLSSRTVTPQKLSTNSTPVHQKRIRAFVSRPQESPPGSNPLVIRLPWRLMSASACQPLTLPQSIHDTPQPPSPQRDAMASKICSMSPMSNSLTAKLPAILTSTSAIAFGRRRRQHSKQRPSILAEDSLPSPAGTKRPSLTQSSQPNTDRNEGIRNVIIRPVFDVFSCEAETNFFSPDYQNAMSRSTEHLLQSGPPRTKNTYGRRQNHKSGLEDPYPNKENILCPLPSTSPNISPSLSLSSMSKPSSLSSCYELDSQKFISVENHTPKLVSISADLPLYENPELICKVDGLLPDTQAIELLLNPSIGLNQPIDISSDSIESVKKELNSALPSEPHRTRLLPPTPKKLSLSPIIHPASASNCDFRRPIIPSQNSSKASQLQNPNCHQSNLGIPSLSALSAGESICPSAASDAFKFEVLHQDFSRISADGSIRSGRLNISSANGFCESIITKKAISKVEKLLNTTISSKSTEITASQTRDRNRRIEKLRSAIFFDELLTNTWPEVASLYHVSCKIGEGTFSTVFKAYRRNSPCMKIINTLLPQDSITMSRKYVALKKITPSSSQKRIIGELTILAELRRHPCIAGLITSYRKMDEFILVLPYCEHQDFREYMGNLAVSELRYYFRSLFSALQYCHSKEIMHRDVKPSNFLYSPSKRHGVLVDFGLAQKVSTKRQNQGQVLPRGNDILRADSRTSPNDVVGSPIARIPEIALGSFKSPVIIKSDTRPSISSNRAGTRGFRAPEVLISYPNQTCAIDMWSAGVVLLCFLTKRYLFFDGSNEVIALQEIAIIFGARRLYAFGAKLQRIILIKMPNISNEGVSLRDLVYTCNSKKFSDIPEEALEMLTSLLTLDPSDRITAFDALRHPWLKDYR